MTSWHVVITRVGDEFLAQHNLRQAGYRALLPFEKVRKAFKVRFNRPDRVDWIRRAYFPGYLFVRVTEGQDVAGVNDALFVSTVLYQGDEPLPVPVAVIEELQEKTDLQGCIGQTDTTKPKPLRKYVPGERVIFAEGSPLAGWAATIHIDGKTQAVVFSDVLRRKITVPKSQIEPAA